MGVSEKWGMDRSAVIRTYGTAIFRALNDPYLWEGAVCWSCLTWFLVMSCPHWCRNGSTKFKAQLFCHQGGSLIPARTDIQGGQQGRGVLTVGCSKRWAMDIDEAQCGLRMAKPILSFGSGMDRAWIGVWIVAAQKTRLHSWNWELGAKGKSVLAPCKYLRETHLTSKRLEGQLLSAQVWAEIPAQQYTGKGGKPQGAGKDYLELGQLSSKQIQIQHLSA